MNTIGFLDSAWRGSSLRRAPAAAQSWLRRSSRFCRSRSASARTRRFFSCSTPSAFARCRSREPAAARRQSASRRHDQPGAPDSSSGRRAVLTNPLWERIRDRQQAFSSVFAWGSPGVQPDAPAVRARNAQGLWVSGDFFNTLGVPARCSAACSRLPTIGAAARRRPPSSATASGSASMAAARPRSAAALTLDGHAYDIVGVTPAELLRRRSRPRLRRRGAAVRRAALARRAHRASTRTTSGSSRRSAG